MSLPPLRHVPQSLLDPFDAVQSITHDLMIAQRQQSISGINSSACLDARIELHSTLARCRSTMDDVYTTANEAVKELGVQREAAITARLAKLNRDWYTSHLDADIDSYERADLSFDPPDLISVQELRASITIANDLEAFDKLTPREVMTRRFNAEKIERARAKVNVARQEKARKEHLEELKTKLDKEDKWASEALRWIELSNASAKLYEIDLAAIAAERAAAKAKGLDPNKLGEEDDQVLESDQEVEEDVKSEVDDMATAGGESMVDVVMSDVTAGEEEEGSKTAATSGRSTPEMSGMGDVVMSDVDQLVGREEEEEEGALV